MNTGTQPASHRIDVINSDYCRGCATVIAGWRYLATSAYQYNALGGKTSSMSCQVVMHRNHHNHYHHRHNQDYVAHHRYEPSEEEELLPCFDANKGREKSGTVTKEVIEFATLISPMTLTKDRSCGYFPILSMLISKSSMVVSSAPCYLNVCTCTTSKAHPL